MQNLPLYIGALLAACTFYVVYITWRAAGRSSIVLYVLIPWLVLQGILAYSGFYLDTKSLPPRFALAIVPALAGIVILVTTQKGKAFTDRLLLPELTLLHVVRIPVEIVLFALCIHKAVPEMITFEGNNFDIISGITAPLIWYFVRQGLNYKFIIAWNVVCIILLANVVITAILAAPFAFQQLSFDQPTVAILYFPFVWLPACIVPLVLFSHIAAIRRLLRLQGDYKVKLAKF